MNRRLFGALVLLCLMTSCSDSCRRSSPPQNGGIQTPVVPSKPAVPSTQTLAEAQQNESVSIAVHGIDVQSMHVEVTSSHPGTITIPVGTVFGSSSAGTQNMMAAETVQLTFAGTLGIDYPSPQTQSLDLEVYCINRMLEAPTDQSGFMVSGGGSVGERDPVRRLAACLEGKESDHYARQLAIWMTSDHFVDMTEDQVLGALRDHAEELLTSDKTASDLRRMYPNLTEAQIQEIRNSPEFRKIVMQAASDEIDKEINLYKTKARALLEQCGFDVANAKFFQN